MFLCLRVDVDYVPWDEPDAQEFGHGEPAMVLRLLHMARESGAKYHFFASERVMRAFPALGESVLSDGHHLDWLNKHPHDFEQRYGSAVRAFDPLGVRLRGFAVRGPWPEELNCVDLPAAFEFLSAPPGSAPAGPKLFPVESRPERDALRAGQTVRVWCDGVKAAMREKAAVGNGITVVVRPQVLAKVDPKLKFLREILSFGLSLGLSHQTLRECIDRAT